ncbi:MAG: CPBP family intramembrane metalloprotease, partial [Kocuria sp.]|nr:CPBP family intramembrane metalloprotease [Kocuria sp.]
MKSETVAVSRETSRAGDPHRHIFGLLQSYLGERLPAWGMIIASAVVFWLWHAPFIPGRFAPTNWLPSLAILALHLSFSFVFAQDGGVCVLQRSVPGSAGYPPPVAGRGRAQDRRLRAPRRSDARALRGLDRGMLTLGSTRTEGSRLYSAHPRGGGSAVFSRVVGPGSSQRVMLTRTTLQLHCVRVISPGGPVPGHRRVPGTRVREGKLRRPTIANAAGRGLRRTYRRCHYRENS